MKQIHFSILGTKMTELCILFLSVHKIMIYLIQTINILK